MMTVMSILRRLRRLSGRPCSLAIRVALFVVYAAALTYLDAANLKTVSALDPDYGRVLSDHQRRPPLLRLSR